MTEPAAEEWRRLYQRSVEFRDLAPWRWIYEEDIFAVQLSAGAEPFYCSVMGTLGEHMALAAYRGVEGLYSFYGLAEAAEEAMMMMVVVVVMMMELDQLQQRLLLGAGEIVRDQRFAGIWNRFQQLGIRRCRRRSRWRDGSGIGAVQRQ